MKRRLLHAVQILLILGLFSTVLAEYPLELVFQKSSDEQLKIGHVGPIKAITFDPDGSLYILEESKSRIIHLDTDLKYISHAGGFGFGEGSFRDPSDIVMVGFELWVCDPLGGRIIRFDRHFAPLGAFGGTLDEEDDFPFERPVSLTKTSNGDIALIEGDLQEVLLLDINGRLIERVGYGKTNIQLVSPVRIVSGRMGQIAIVDEDRDDIIMLDIYGSFKGIQKSPFSDTPIKGLAFQDKKIWICGEEGIVVRTGGGETIGSWDQNFFGGPVNDIDVQDNILAVVVEKCVKTYRIERIAR